MNTLDYATFFETHVRPRQRRRAVFRTVVTVALALTPVLTALALAPG